MSKHSRPRSLRNPRRPKSIQRASANSQISSEEAIKAGEQIAMAAFASGLKLAAAFGTVAAKTAGLALASLASGADKFSELVKEEALRSYNGTRSAGSKRKRARTSRTEPRKKPA